MKCTCGNNISTPEFLGTLDLSQLLRAIEIAHNLADQKTAQKKVTIYRVLEDSGYCHSNHLSFQEAAESFAKVAGDMADKGELPRELSIVRERHIESEVKDYCPEYVGHNA